MMQSLLKIAKRLQKNLAHAGVLVSSSTVRRRLLKFSRKAKKPLRKYLLKVKMKKKRLEWARELKSW